MALLRCHSLWSCIPKAWVSWRSSWQPGDVTLRLPSMTPDPTLLTHHCTSCHCSPPRWPWGSSSADGGARWATPPGSGWRSLSAGALEGFRGLLGSGSGSGRIDGSPGCCQSRWRCGVGRSGQLKNVDKYTVKSV